MCNICRLPCLINVTHSKQLKIPLVQLAVQLWIYTPSILHFQGLHRFKLYWWEISISESTAQNAFGNSLCPLTGKVRWEHSFSAGECRIVLWEIVKFYICNVGWKYSVLESVRMFYHFMGRESFVVLWECDKFCC